MLVANSFQIQWRISFCETQLAQPKEKPCLVCRRLAKPKDYFANKHAKSIDDHSGLQTLVATS